MRGTLILQAWRNSSPMDAHLKRRLSIRECRCFLRPQYGSLLRTPMLGKEHIFDLESGRRIRRLEFNPFARPSAKHFERYFPGILKETSSLESLSQVAGTRA